MARHQKPDSRLPPSVSLHIAKLFNRHCQRRLHSEKMRGLGLLNHVKSHRHRHAFSRSSVQLDHELSQASTEDMKEMRDCYESLFFAAASTTNTAYEFSESLQEIGDCLLKQTALSDDDDISRVLLMLGKVQFHIQKLIDNYRSHVYHTITVPSESFLHNLHVAEEMKRKCDEKRSTYEALKIKHDINGRFKNSKVSSHQLQSALDEFDEDAALFIFRIKSLKIGQSRSLLIQATRHYAAQMAFFRKALKSLEAIEPHVKSITEKQHFDYCFSGFADINEDDEDEDNSGDQHVRQSSTRKLHTYVLPTPIEESTSVTSRNQTQRSQRQLSTSELSSTRRPKFRQLHQLPIPPAGTNKKT